MPENLTLRQSRTATQRHITSVNSLAPRMLPPLVLRTLVTMMPPGTRDRQAQDTLELLPVMASNSSSSMCLKLVGILAHTGPRLDPTLLNSRTPDSRAHPLDPCFPQPTNKVRTRMLALLTAVLPLPPRMEWTPMARVAPPAGRGCRPRSLDSRVPCTRPHHRSSSSSSRSIPRPPKVITSSRPFLRWASRRMRQLSLKILSTVAVRTKKTRPCPRLKLRLII
jgi:hypothetical protein